MSYTIYRLVLTLLVFAAIICSASGDAHGRGSRGSNKVHKVAQAKQAAPSANSTQEMNDSKQRIFTLLVEHTFDPQTRGHAELYYKTRFFAAHLQARMRYIESQHELEVDGTVEKDDTVKPSTDESEQMGLTQAEAEDLNSIMREMWLASRKLYQNWGCLSYDLTICNGQISKGRKLTDSEKAAMIEWEKRLSTPFEASTNMSKEDAGEVHDLTKGILAVLLSADSALQTQ
ncbi:hypothetical protein IW140_001948 [Coemansia sp. RSA 1813]|nr:hypothetical protein EV178_001568 [Coemansia sp. RSA 1646]KAJ1771633.1 hypothetical protein LPJ74_002188 [Coemansia sp. RSA 1843]KAJ2089935.1 hypothetical protein IW138_003065 [Coemansia sp. RSA 986]KAJ2215252.1 hypothetical protein EV179_002340 [Coemansia sp. RSA 487]KAJ2570994.1 hypothetical protein IW140_001948 [Coemansia sp. RSA 1813]